MVTQVWQPVAIPGKGYIMNARLLTSLLFAAAAIYDGVIGIAFLLFANPIFGWLEITPPNHFGYVQFPAALLLVFAALFTAIARDPLANRHLIIYGMGLKLSYCGVVLFHWITTGLPWIWKPFCLADLVFLILFTWAWTTLKPSDPRHRSA